MTTTTEASTEARTPVKSSATTSVVVGDDAWITVRHFTDHPNLGSYQVVLNYDTTLYLTEDSARALVRRLGRKIASAQAEAVSA